MGGSDDRAAALGDQAEAFGSRLGRQLGGETPGFDLVSPGQRQLGFEKAAFELVGDETSSPGHLEALFNQHLGGFGLASRQQDLGAGLPDEEGGEGLPGLMQQGDRPGAFPLGDRQIAHLEAGRGQARPGDTFEARFTDLIRRGQSLLGQLRSFLSPARFRQPDRQVGLRPGDWGRGADLLAHLQHLALQLDRLTGIAAPGSQVRQEALRLGDPEAVPSC